MVEKGIFGSVLIKKQHYWPKVGAIKGGDLAHEEKGIYQRGFIYQ